LNGSRAAVLIIHGEIAVPGLLLLRRLKGGISIVRISLAIRWIAARETVAFL
jgi:hypothetical protein